MEDFSERTPPAGEDASSTVGSTATPLVSSPTTAELTAIQADLNDELSIAVNAKRRYRWFAGISVTYAPIFVGLGIELSRPFLLIGLVGILSVVLGTALFFREHARWRALRAELLSTELLSYKQPLHDP
jgi:hypothetical protein